MELSDGFAKQRVVGVERAHKPYHTSHYERNRDLDGFCSSYLCFNSSLFEALSCQI